MSFGNSTRPEPSLVPSAFPRKTRSVAPYWHPWGRGLNSVHRICPILAARRPPTDVGSHLTKGRPSVAELTALPLPIRSLGCRRYNPTPKRRADLGGSIRSCSTAGARFRLSCNRGWLPRLSDVLRRSRRNRPVGQDRTRSMQPQPRFSA